MSDSRKRRGSAALPSYMRYERPRHNPADRGSLVKAISAAVVLATVVILAVRTDHGGESFVGTRYYAFTAVRIHTAVVVQQHSLRSYRSIVGSTYRPYSSINKVSSGTVVVRS